jgi:carbonic anhydrase
LDIIYRYEPFERIERRPAQDAREALKALESGHLRYRETVDRVKAELEGNAALEPLVIKVDPLRLGFRDVAGVPLHTPYALVLGCSDARAPIEKIFDQSPNDLFVIRVAGNVLGTECLGSIDYAVRNLGGSLSLVVVLGHTGCGAVTAAVDLYLAPYDYPDLGLTYALRTLVDRVLIAVRGAAKAIARVCGGDAKNQPGYRTALIETAVYLNAALTAFDVRREVEMFQSDSRIKVVYGVFDLADQRLRSQPDQGEEPPPPFAEVAARPGDLEDIGDRIVTAIVARGAL